jgi:hypothetical protein
MAASLSDHINLRLLGRVGEAPVIDPGCSWFARSARELQFRAPRRHNRATDNPAREKRCLSPRISRSGEVDALQPVR